MKLSEIMDKCKDLNVDQERVSDEDYVELVFSSEEQNKWDEILSEFLDAPCKPPGEKPKWGDSKLTSKYGGINKNQTLFKKEFDNCTIIAMFWPWSDENHVTLKLIKI